PKIYENRFNDIEENKLAILSWDHGSFGYKGRNYKILIHNIQLISMENCTSYISPIIELRTYEFCIKLKKKINTVLGHGAAIVDSRDFHVFGIFAWGERQQKFLPSIALNLSHFKGWVDSVTLFIPLHG
ncbi:jg474, partial [Pararge aegeria aegeria]